MQSVGKAAWNLMVVLLLVDLARFAGAALMFPLLGTVGLAVSLNLPKLFQPVEWDAK